MFLRFFRMTGAQVLFMILLLSILLWLPSFIHAPKVMFFFNETQMPLYKFFTNLISYDSFVAKLITYLLILLQAFLLVRLNTRFIFINNRTYLPALFYILLTASIPAIQRFNPAIFAGFFMILALEKIFDSYKASKLAYEFFTASVLVATAALFYPYMVYFILILFISLGTLKPFRWREWVFVILGFLLPFYFIFSYYYLFFDEPYRLWSDFSSVFFHSFPRMTYSIPVIIFAGLIAFIILLSTQFLIKTYAMKKILPRKAFGIFMWIFVISILVYIFDKNVSAEMIYIAAIPLSFLVSHYFALLKSEFWGNIYLLTIFILLVVIHIF